MKNVLIVALIAGLGFTGCISRKMERPINENKFTVIELGKDSVFFVINYRVGNSAVQTKKVFHSAGYIEGTLKNRCAF